MKCALIILFLALGACAKYSSPPAQECQSYASPYLVEFPDKSVRKAGVESCGSLLKATDLTPGVTESVVAETLQILIWDDSTTPRSFYMTTFSGGD